MPTQAQTRVLLISPVRNEAEHIAQVAIAVAGQTRPPDLWLVIDDGSEDATLAELTRLEGEIEFLRVLRYSDDAGGAGDRLAAAADARAFNQALASVDWSDFTHIGKLDGDIELPPTTWSGCWPSSPRGPCWASAAGGSWSASAHAGARSGSPTTTCTGR